MEKDFDQWITIFQELFKGRRDCYGVQPGKSEKQPLTPGVLLGHLKGRRRIGVYPLVENKCKFTAIDLDNGNFQHALRIKNDLGSYGLPAYIECSKSKGYHVWLFFSDWTEARKVRLVLKATLKELALDAEIFPKQDSTTNTNGGFGNYIYLPLFNFEYNGGRTVFLDEEGNPYPEQIKVLQQIQRVNPASLDKILQAKTETKSNNLPAPLPSTPVSYINDPFSAILSNCEYLEGLRWKLKETGDLDHIERIYFANVFLPLPGGRDWIIDMFSCLSDFNTKVTETQLNSLKSRPTLCSSMCTELCEAIRKLNAKSPIAFALDGQIATETVAELVSKEKYPPFPEEGYIGIADEFASLYSDRLESPKPFFYFSFLTFLGCVGSPYLRLAGALKEQCRMYTILIGPSADPRKSTAPRLTGDQWEFFELLEGDQKEHARQNYFKRLFGGGSAEGLAKTIQTTRLPVLLYYDELRSFVEKAKQDGSVLLPLVTTLFSENRWANYTKVKKIEINDAHLSLIGACTEETFGNMWTPAFIDIGFMNRLFLVAAETDKLVPNPPDLPEEEVKKIKNGISTRLSWLIEKAKASTDGIARFNFSAEAEELWNEYYRSIDRTSEYTKRLDTYGLRLMLLLTLSSSDYQTATLSKDIVERVIKILKWELEIRKLVSPIDADTLLAKVEEKIRKALSRKPMKKREIQQSIHASRYGIDVFRKALGNLCSDGQVFCNADTQRYSLDKGGKV